MRRSFTILLVAIVMVVSFGDTSAAGTLFRCKGKDAVGMKDDGTLSRDSGAALSGIVDFWIIDIASGMVRIVDGRHQDKSTPPAELGPFQWFVTQRGNRASDTVLVRLVRFCKSCGNDPSLANRDHEDFNDLDLADAAKEFIRIRQWEGMKSILFQHFLLDTLVTGICEPIH